VSRLTGAISGIITIITIVVLSVYLVAQEEGVKHFVKAVTPLKYRPYIVSLVDRLQEKMGEWLRGQLILMLFVGGLTYLGLWLMGVNYALILAIVAGLLEVIPIIGIPIAIIPALLISFTQNPVLALFVLILYIVIQQVENHILVPKVMQKAVGLNPVFVIIALLVGYKLGGILGVLISVPAATAISVFIKDFYEYKVNRDKENLEALRKEKIRTGGH
jgi:predicted PurR-regulated permease PerM